MKIRETAAISVPSQAVRTPSPRLPRWDAAIHRKIAPAKGRPRSRAMWGRIISGPRGLRQATIQPTCKNSATMAAARERRRCCARVGAWDGREGSEGRGAASCEKGSGTCRSRSRSDGSPFIGPLPCWIRGPREGARRRGRPSTSRRPRWRPAPAPPLPSTCPRSE